MAVSYGLGATALIVGSNLWFVRTRDEGTFQASKAMQPTFDKACWMLMAAVLLVNAVDAMNRAFFHDTGIYFLTSTDYRARLWGSEMTSLDVVSLSVGVTLMFAMSFIPWVSPSESRTLARKRFKKILFRWYKAILVAAVVMSAILLGALKNPHAGAERVAVPDNVDTLSAVFSVIGIAAFFVGYLANHRSFFDLGPGDEDPEPASAKGATPPSAYGKVDQLVWQHDLRRLRFEAVFLPPLIAGVALVGGVLDSGAVMVFGFFIYGGFGLWSLAVRVVRGYSRGKGAIVFGLSAIGFQFIYAFMMTVLWTTALIKLESFVLDHVAFKVALNVALAAIFIQVVFGPIYRNVWARALSDEWIMASPEYVIVATMICASLAGLQQEWYKPVLIVVAVLLCIFGPANILRRSLTAYVLLRVKPGKTELVRKRSMASDLASSTVYGEYDVLVKIEVPGRLSMLPKDARKDYGELSELARRVHSEIRCMKGDVMETQTLLDFSDFVDVTRKKTGAPTTSPSAVEK